MSLLWTLIAAFLIGEIVIIFLFLLPVPSAQKWRKIFQFRPFAFINDYTHIIVLALVAMFADSIKSVSKYNNEVENLKNKGEGNHHPESVQISYLNLFRAQRNIYISGFSLFLWLVINRLVKLLSSHGLLLSLQEAAKKQAISATEAAQKFVDESQIKDTKTENSEQAMVEMQHELEEAKKSLEFSNSELKTTNADLEALKSRAEETKREYEKLLNEVNQMTKSDETSKVN